MSVRLHRWLAILLLLCMPLQALAALDRLFCSEQGYGDSGSAVAESHDKAPAGHEQMSFGGLTFDSCALCHIGCAPVNLERLFDKRLERIHVFVPVPAAAWIEHDPTPLKRPPRHLLA